MFSIKKFISWLIATVITAPLAVLTIANVIELPFHDRARDVVRFGSGEDFNTAYDARGNVIANWQRNNPMDDIIKFALLALAIFTFWKLLSTFIKWWWLRLLIILLLVPSIYWVYVLATW